MLFCMNAIRAPEGGGRLLRLLDEILAHGGEDIQQRARFHAGAAVYLAAVHDESPFFMVRVFPSMV